MFISSIFCCFIVYHKATRGAEKSAPRMAFMDLYNFLT